ncbi:fatty acid metabolism regulator protein [Spirochaetia bacterium]|nr:fatty acid metabolism regulator protein [Spirochaetia bacterium]GHV22818.1 fatty acid metabolism regulator protein [Spirochaetia bacterium]
MSIIIEHDKRRSEILQKALEVFIDEGFEDTTYQKIADRCGITRTTLYMYFKNKKDIFNYSIKQLLSDVENDVVAIRKDKKLSFTERLTKIVSTVIDRLEENKNLLSVILDYLRYIAKGETDPDYRVRKRTIKLRHILAQVVIDGIRTGELKNVNVKAADDLLYGLIESAIYRLVVLKRDSAAEVKAAAAVAVQMLAL